MQKLNLYCYSFSEDMIVSSDLSKPEFDGMWNQHKPYKAAIEVCLKHGATTGPKMQQVWIFDNTCEPGV